MHIYIARHGRTNYNDLGLSNADPSIDVHLTQEGLTQANALADRLKSVPIEHIFVSQLKRTQQTAEIVNKFHHVALEVDVRLNDGRTGYEGQPFQIYMNALEASDNKWTARFNDGESIEDIKKHAADFLKDLRAKQYKTVLIVTSQWVVRALLAILRDISNEEAWELKVEQGSCVKIEW